MKVSKILLQAMAVAITASVATSCTKASKQAPVITEEKTPTTTPIPYYCPTCGMG
jgi:hypothetical protein